jgi:hypothetical protein
MLPIYGILILIVILIGAQSLVYSEKIRTFAHAISVAEGFGIPHAIPTQAHNPGDMVLGDKGFGTLGAEGVTIFQDDATGWNALYHELSLIVNGYSHVYNLDMTISEMAQKWTDTQSDSWAINVARNLNATVDTDLRSLLT